ncbi:phage replisome organizer N-terminal domain-containing protein [Clostridium gasigenes]|uniref:phage replisome organizer N-terminal domain-containing protein n=1 Tax=Clostridium gasigenes TaxID=94869 RepID=UPI001C0DD1A1|nr:phage replisome organizer N-terminal domain-containing protein [Clostridium gasigenes]MBU3102954.1 phage replisome organizer N-terminal domain-containing protein [Clostridium gasigenes]
MSDNKKYYYLKLKEHFFESEEVRIMEAMPNGMYYSNLLLKLYLKSLKREGELRFNDFIPYSVEMISTITNINIDIVRSGIQVLQQMKLIEMLDDGSIYMMNIQNFIGQSSTEADRIREYRNKIDNKKKCLLDEASPNFVQMYDKRTPETETELETELEIQQQHNVTNVLSELTKEEVKSIIKYCKENNVPVDVVVEKWEIVKNLKSVKNRVGALIAAIKNDWDKPKGHTGNTFVDGCSSRDYDHNAIEKALLGWNNDED